MDSRSALVTGGSGFVGRALMSRLARDGWTVTCVGRRSPGVPGTHFVPLLGYDGAALRGALGRARFDAVFHLAAYGVAPGDRDAALTFDVNVAATVAVVRAAAQAGADSFVYTGSCAEYEPARVDAPILEDHRLTAQGLYGVSKAAGGTWGQAVARQLQLPFVWLRPFGIYGEGEAPHRLLPSIRSRLRLDTHVDLSFGDQIRDMLHVSDAVEGLLAAERVARSGHLGPFNLCSGHPISVKAFASAVADAMCKPRDLLKFGAVPVRPGENMWLVGCGEAFAAASGFRPRLSLQEGIARSLMEHDGRAEREG